MMLDGCKRAPSPKMQLNMNHSSRNVSGFFYGTNPVFAWHNYVTKRLLIIINRYHLQRKYTPLGDVMFSQRSV